VYLVTGKSQYRLQRLDGNAFSDPVLDALVGKSITADGTAHGNVFIASSWTVND